jgi:hypothetical protein
MQRMHIGCWLAMVLNSDDVHSLTLYNRCTLQTLTGTNTLHVSAEITPEREYASCAACGGNLGGGQIILNVSGRYMDAECFEVSLANLRANGGTPAEEAFAIVVEITGASWDDAPEIDTIIPHDGAAHRVVRVDGDDLLPDAPTHEEIPGHWCFRVHLRPAEVAR